MKLGEYIQQGDVILLAAINGNLIRFKDNKYELISDRITDSEFLNIILNRSFEWKEASEEMVSKYVKEATGKEMIHIKLRKLQESLK